MKNGWIKCENTLPPLGEDVIISYSNPAYGGHCFVVIGKRVDEHFVFIGDFKINLFNINKPYPYAYVTCWAYNNGQKLLPNPCNYPCCVKD